MQVVEFSDGMFTLFRNKCTQTIHSNVLLLDVMCIVSSGTLYCRSVVTDKHDYLFCTLLKESCI